MVLYFNSELKNEYLKLFKIVFNTMNSEEDINSNKFNNIFVKFYSNRLGVYSSQLYPRSRASSLSFSSQIEINLKEIDEKIYEDIKKVILYNCGLGSNYNKFGIKNYYFFEGENGFNVIYQMIKYWVLYCEFNDNIVNNKDYLNTNIEYANDEIIKIIKVMTLNGNNIFEIPASTFYYYLEKMPLSKNFSWTKALGEIYGRFEITEEEKEKSNLAEMKLCEFFGNDIKNIKDIEIVNFLEN